MKPPVWFERPILPELADEVTSQVEVLNPSPGDEFAGLSEAIGAVAAVRPYDARLMDAAPRLLVIARTGIGVDTVDIAEATRRGIAVCNAPDGPTISTAEHAIMLLMMVAKNAIPSVAALQAGGAEFYARHRAIELMGKTLGLVGCGRIARRVGMMAQAIGMRVLTYDPYVDDVPDGFLQVETLEELLGQSDAVSLHVPLSEATRGFFDADRLNAMRAGSILINTARGGLVDQAALLDAVDRGHLWGAGLDVTEPEPLPPDHPLLHRDSIVVTPHVASGTFEGKRNNFSMALAQILQVATGERPPHIVNPEVWDRVLERRRTEWGT